MMTRRTYQKYCKNAGGEKILQKFAEWFDFHLKYIKMSRLGYIE